MSTAEAWPTEAAATEAVDAAARKFFEDAMARQAAALPPSWEPPTWEGLGVEEKLGLRQQVLPLIWAAVGALSDPRYGAWAEGYEAGQSDGAFEASGSGTNVTYPHRNPYPSGL